ncbi:MAG TPA: hypothetical protein VMM92_04555 [Thermoanaerobaculia bacterium]|nr:hypothetical protein [Thermoanaerobaculia bacterium]
MRLRSFRRAGVLSVMLWAGLWAGAAQVGASNLIYQGGPVIQSAKVVLIFWGPSFANAASADHVYATTLQAYRNQLGTNHEYNVITQYYQIVGGVKQFIQLSNLAAGTADWFDTSTPPANVTDAAVQAEVQRYIASHSADGSTIYAVFLPSTSYSSDNGETSCGGPALGYCSYHGLAAGSTGTAIKYAVQPYPSCSGCQVSGWSAVSNQEHFVAYSVRSTAMNPRFNSWYDASGADGNDICLWTPPPFMDAGGAYPYEWSNLASGCVKWR